MIALRGKVERVIQQLREKGIEKIVLLASDSAPTVSTIAAESGVDEFYAGLALGDKARKIRDLAARYGGVAVVAQDMDERLRSQSNERRS